MADNDDRSFGTVAVTASFLAIGLAAIYWISRAGLANPIRPVIEVTLVSLFMINAPYTARLISVKLDVRRGWATSYGSYWLLAILITALAGRYAGNTVLPVFLAAGALTFLVTMVDWLRHGSLWRSAIVIIGSLAFSTFAGGVVWGRIYKSPLFMEMLATTGIVHHDPISLAAIASMLLTYGVPTVGLDGIPYMPYHWGSPWLFAQLSRLLGRSPLDFYNLGYVITIVPFFFGGILAFATEMRSTLAKAASVDLRDNLRLLAILGIAVVGVFPITSMDRMGVWTSNLIISESYAVGLPVALLLVAITVVYWKSEARGWIYPLLILPAGIIALGYLKISFMILGFLAVLYAGARTGFYRKPVYLLAGVALTGLFLFTFTNVSLPAHREGLVPLDFLKSFVPFSWWPFFFLVHLFWSWLYIVLRLRTEGVDTFADLKRALSAGQILDVEIVALVAVAGVGPGLVAHIDGGSAFYFSDIQRWLSVGLLIGTAGTLVRIRSERLESGEARRFAFGATSVRSLFVALVALPLLASMASNFVHWTRQMGAQNRAVKVAIAEAGGIDRTRNQTLLTELVSLRELPLEERRRTGLFIPQTESGYWTLLARPGACSFSGHIAPTLTGMAMIDGMPPSGCTLSPYYGLSLFEPRSRQQMPADTVPAALCRRATRWGLTRVMTVHFDSTGRALRRVDECRNAA
jgi:hypothetical protein